MKIIATRNVNSLKMRLSQVIQWLSQHKPHILALQETKTIDEKCIEVRLIFPREHLRLDVGKTNEKRVPQTQAPCHRERDGNGIRKEVLAVEDA